MIMSCFINGRELSGDELVKVDVVVVMTGLAKRTVQDMTSARTIPCYKVTSRAVRYKVSEIIEWLNERKVA